MAIKLAYLGVAVLAIIAVILGYKIYQQQTAINNPPPVTQQPQNRSTPRPLLNQATSGAIQQPATKNANITEDRKIISNYPGPSATEDQKKEFGTIIANNTQVSDTLEITNCETSPLVLKVKKGSTINFVNNDSSGNAILFGPGQQYEVPANSRITIAVNLNTGINSYRCTGISGSPIVGVFLVNE